MSKTIRLKNNILVESHPEHIRLGALVQEKFLELCAMYLRRTEQELVPPAELRQDMLLWRKMCMRHKKGDYRNTEDEIYSVARVAQWTTDVKRKLANQEPKQVWENAEL